MKTSSTQRVWADFRRLLIKTTLLLFVLLAGTVSVLRADPAPAVPSSPNTTSASTTTGGSAPASAGSTTITASTTTTGGSVPAQTSGYYWTYGIMAFLLAVLAIGILKGLRGWSLGAALSEDTGNGVFKPSISRLIALLGFSIIVSIYLGVGSSVIFRILSGGAVTDLSGLGTFLASAAALFAPYLANQIKGAVVGMVNSPTGSTAGSAASVTAFSPKTVTGIAPQKISVTGANLSQIQSAVCTLQSGAESAILAKDVNVLNGGAVEVTVSMAAPQAGAASYTSTLTLVTATNQRIPVGDITVS